MTATTADLTLEENASLFTRMRKAIRALNILKDDPGHPIAGALVNACLDAGVYRAIIRNLKQSEDGSRLLAERPSLQGPDLDLSVLERLPEESFGHAFARYFRDNGIHPFITLFEVRTDSDYISKRYRETHDIFHVLTGYGTDIAGEMELQAFAMGNLGIRAPLLIVPMGSLMLLKDRPKGFRAGDFFRRIWKAYRRGKQTPSLLRFPYELHWSTPLETLRAQLSL